MDIAMPGAPMKDLSRLIGELHEHAKHVVEERARADALFVNIGDGAIVTDEQGMISRVNKTALELLGCHDKELLGKWFPKAIVAVDEDGEPLPLMDRAITKAFLTGKTVSQKMFYIRKNKKIFPVQCTVSPIMLEDKPIGAIEVFRDISSDYELARMRDEFISIASHQLRTPATAVKNFIGLLKDGYAGDLSNEQTQLIEMAYESNEHQLEIVNNLLYVARTDSDAVQLKYKQVDVNKLVADVAKEQKRTIDDRRQKLNMLIPKKPVTITADRQFVHMLVENLLSNASKYTPNGGNIGLELTAEPNAPIVIKVADNGVGIPPEDIDKLFQKFSRIENELSTERGGSGIGLYLVKRIADLHHGSVDVVSKAGEGTIFTVTMPREQPK
jgi:two-component system phosphate regulon sensor histidine kinase PhoR